MQHSFDVEIAKEFGLLEAILLKNLEYWIEKNKANNKHFHDGYYWTYNSTRAFSEIFPYVSQRQIQSALKRLEEKGIILTGNYNEEKYDRTLWYTISTNGINIMQKCKMDYAKKGNGFDKSAQPIPNINTYNKQENINISDDIFIKEKAKTFQKPTLEEVGEYCASRGNKIDAQYFIDYYESNGWKVGKNKMKDWKATVRTWERNPYNKKKETQSEMLDRWIKEAEEEEKRNGTK